MRDFEPVAYADGLVYALSNGGPRYPSVPRGPLTYATPATTPRLAAVADAAVPDDRRGRRPGRTGQPQTFQEPSPPRVRKAGHRAAAEVHDIEEHQVRGHPRGPVHRPGGGLASPMRCGSRSKSLWTRPSSATISPSSTTGRALPTARREDVGYAASAFPVQGSPV